MKDFVAKLPRSLREKRVTVTRVGRTLAWYPATLLWYLHNNEMEKQEIDFKLLQSLLGNPRKQIEKTEVFVIMLKQDAFYFVGRLYDKEDA